MLKRAIEESLKGLEDGREEGDEEARQLEIAIKMSLVGKPSSTDDHEQQPCSSRSLLAPTELHNTVNDCVQTKAEGNTSGLGGPISSTAARVMSTSRGARDEEIRRKRLEYFDRLDKR